MILKNLRTYFKKIFIQFKDAPFHNMEVNLSNFILIIKKGFLLLAKIYFKAHIRLLHFLTENTFAYLIYIFLAAYGSYGGKDTGVYELSHYIATFFVLYCFGTGLFLFLVCKLKVPRQILENLVTKEYIIKYLGEYTASKLLVKLAVPSIALAGLETFTSRSGLETHQSNLDAVYEKCYGENGQDWSEKTREKYLAAQERARILHKDGIITKAMTSQETKAFYKTIGETLSSVGNSVSNIFKK